jgi:hypothetical protein
MPPPTHPLLDTTAHRVTELEAQVARLEVDIARMWIALQQVQDWQMYAEKLTGGIAPE